MKHGVEVRPGFLGKWIEFTNLQTIDTDEILYQMRQRFLKPCMEMKSAMLTKQLMENPDLMHE